ncbi:MAG: flavin reductase family protein [Alphaproteobacteria bacterium]|nr:flavin reductase family protein [Alphaproteobacteria bacterium]
MAIDSIDFRRALGHFATGITVVSCADAEGRLYGVTVNSFNSVSLNPSLVLFSLGMDGASTPAFLAAKEYGISMLAEGQEAVSRHFAQAQPDKWATTPHDVLGNGCPVVRGSMAHLSCRRYALYGGGDHTIVVAEVMQAVFHTPELPPLLYFRGSYRSLQK